MHGVPEPVAINAMRKAAIDFCERSRVHVVDQTITLAAGYTSHPFEPDNGTVVARVEQAWIDGVDIYPTTRLDLQSANANWATISGTPTNYLQENTEEIILFPKPDSAQTLTLKVALKPSRKSNGIEGWLVEKYLEEIMHGAAWKLLVMVGKPWAEPSAALYHKGAFDDGIQSARLDAQKGHVKAPLRTKPIYF